MAWKILYEVTFDYRFPCFGLVVNKVPDYYLDVIYLH